MNKLREAFSRKEQAERLLSNLENLKQEGTLDDAQYQSMKNDYAQKLVEASTEIEKIKDEINTELKAKQRELSSYNQELENLEVRFKVGELTEDTYRKAAQKAKDTIEKTQSKVSELQKLLEATSSSDAGGYTEASAVPTGAQLATGSAMERISIGEMFSKAWNICIRNPIILVPALLLFVWSLITSQIGWFAEPVVFGGMPFRDFGSLLLSAGILTIVSIILGILSEGMMIEMVAGASEEKGSALLSRGWKAALSKFLPLLLASILYGIIVFIGSLLLVIPGLIALFLFFLIAQAIMIDNEGPISAFGRSYRVVRDNLGDAILIFLAMIGIGIVISLFSFIPVLGDILTLAAMPYFAALTTVLYLSRR